MNRSEEVRSNEKVDRLVEHAIHRSTEVLLKLGAAIETPNREDFVDLLEDAQAACKEAVAFLDDAVEEARQ